MWPSTTCPFSSLTRNVALGRFSVISPCIWMTSSRAIPSACLEVGLFQKRLVLLAHHVALDLGPEVHRDDHDDQQRRAAKIERHVVLENQKLRQQANGSDVDGTG